MEPATKNDAAFWALLVIANLSPHPVNVVWTILAFVALLACLYAERTKR